MTKRVDWVCDGPECQSRTSDLNGDNWTTLRNRGTMIVQGSFETLVVTLHFCSHECLHGWVHGA